MPSGPNLDLYSVFYEYSEGEGYENMEISRHMGIGDIETHTDHPRHFWGIGSRLGHPSKYQNGPRARRNHITASLAMFHAPMHDHMGEIPPSFDGIPLGDSTSIYKIRQAVAPSAFGDTLRAPMAHQRRNFKANPSYAKFPGSWK